MFQRPVHVANCCSSMMQGQAGQLAQPVQAHSVLEFLRELQLAFRIFWTDPPCPPANQACLPVCLESLH